MSGISWRWFCNFKTQGGGDFEFWIINFESFLSLEIDCLGGRWIIRYRNDKVARFHHPSCFQQHENLMEVALHCLPQIPGKMKSAPIANSFTAWHSGIWCKQKLGNLVDFVRGGMPFSLALCKQKSHQLLLCPPFDEQIYRSALESFQWVLEEISGNGYLSPWCSSQH